MNKLKIYDCRILIYLKEVLIFKPVIILSEKKGPKFTFHLALSNNELKFNFKFLWIEIYWIDLIIYALHIDLKY